MTKAFRDRVLEVLDYNPETGVFRWKVATAARVKVGEIAGSTNGDGYQQIGLFGKRYKAHRLAFLIVHGRWPSGEIDHLNRRRTDNRKANLREATRLQNMQNKGVYRNNTSGVTGVRWDARLGKWAASRTIAGKRQHLGVFETLEAAAAARSS